MDSTGASSAAPAVASAGDCQGTSLRQLLARQDAERRDFEAVWKKSLWGALIQASGHHEREAMKIEDAEGSRGGPAAGSLSEMADLAADSSPLRGSAQAPLLTGGDAATHDGSGKQRPLRARIALWIHGPKVQLILIFLLLLDAACVIAELLIESSDQCKTQLYPSDCNATTNNGSAEAFLSSSSSQEGGPFDGHEPFYPPPGCAVVAFKELSHSLHLAESVLSWVSRVILMIFCCEVLTLFGCLGLAFFNVLYTLDAFVVIASLVLSFAVTGPQTGVSAGANIIILLRLWRFARLLHGVGMSVHQVSHQRHQRKLRHGGDHDDPHGSPASSDAPGSPQMQLTLNDIADRHRRELISLCLELEKRVADQQSPCPALKTNDPNNNYNHNNINNHEDVYKKD